MKSQSRRVLMTTVVFAVALCVLLSASLAQSPAQLSSQSQAQAQQESDRKQYADKVRESYNFRFGPGKISVPGNAAIEGNDFIQPGAFPNATYCAGCHAQAYSMWRQALHSNSFRTPFYRTATATAATIRLEY